MKPKRLLALGVLLVGVTAAASLTAAQKPASPQPNEQQNLKERVDALDSELKETEAKANRAAMEKDYIERIQKESKDYYDKVLSTQTWTLGIVGLIITIVSAATARFGLTIFDRHIEQAVSKATTDLETKFDQKLGEERQKLEKSNADQMIELKKDLTLLSDWQFQFLQGMAAIADGRHEDAAGSFRRALEYYKSGKPRNISEKGAGEITIRNLFGALQRSAENASDAVGRVREELKSELFDGLEDELGQVALQFPTLASLIRRRKEAPYAPQPATAPESPPLSPDKAQTAKPQERNNK